MSGTAQDVGQQTSAQAPDTAAARPDTLLRTRRPETVAFRRAVTALAASAPDTDDARGAAAEAAAHVVALSSVGDEWALRSILRPDPDADAVAWTVACYQIGDLTPSALRDFANPVEAVATLLDCEDASHLAAELTASTDDGLRWTAMSRSGADARFQLLGPTTCSGDRDGVRLAAVRHRWEDQLLRWAAAPDQDPLPPPRHDPIPVRAGASEAGGPPPELVHTTTAWTPIPLFPTAEAVNEIVSQVVDAVRAIEPSAVAVHPEVVERLAAIESRLDEVGRALVALCSQALAPPPAPEGFLARWSRRIERLRSIQASVALQVKHDGAPDTRRAVVIDAASND